MKTRPMSWTPALRRKLVAVACLASLSLAACNETMQRNPAASQAVQALVTAATTAGPNGTPTPRLPTAAGGAAKSGTASTAEMVQLLSQSFEQIDERQEVEIGRQLAAILLGSKPLVQDVALQRYVNQLGRWISLQSARPNLPWTFGVLNDPGFNAFATPGGYIFVTRGLVDRMRDEAELGGVLAHEIMHVVHKHHLKAMMASARTSLLANVAASQLRNNTLNTQMLALGRNLLARGLDKEDEYEADRDGVTLAARAGLDPYGLLSSLQQLRGASASDANFALMLSTHPAAQDRVNRLENAMGNRLDAAVSAPQVTIAQRLGRTQARRAAAPAAASATPPAKAPPQAK